MNAKAKIILGVSSTIVVGAVTYGLIKKSINKKLIREIHRVLDSSEGEYGDVQDLYKSNAFDEQYWERAGTENNMLEHRDARILANDIYKAFGGATRSLFTNDDEEGIYGAFKKMKNQVQVSQVAYQYRIISGKSLLGNISSFLSVEEANKVSTMVSNLKQK